MDIKKKTICIVDGLLDSDPDQEFSFQTEKSADEAIQAKETLDKLKEVFELLTLSFVDTLNETVLKTIGDDRDKLISVLKMTLMENLIPSRSRDSNQPINYDTYIDMEHMIVLGFNELVLGLINQAFKPKFEKKLIELRSNDDGYGVKSAKTIGGFSGIGQVFGSSFNHNYAVNSDSHSYGFKVNAEE